MSQDAFDRVTYLLFTQPVSMSFRHHGVSVNIFTNEIFSAVHHSLPVHRMHVRFD